MTKPKSLRKQLGTDVSIEVKALQKDTEANEIIHRIGRELIKQEPGMEYCGSIVLHIYMENNAIAKTTYSLANITNIAMVKDLSEGAILTLWQNAAIRIRSYFNPAFQHKTTDSSDQRGIVK